MIDEKPAEWDGSTPGDFEMDTIVGKDGKGGQAEIPVHLLKQMESSVKSLGV